MTCTRLTAGDIYENIPGYVRFLIHDEKYPWCNKLDQISIDIQLTELLAQLAYEGKADVSH